MPGMLGSDFLLIGKGLIFRLTPRLLRRHRRAGRRSSRISSRTASCRGALRRGGNGEKAGELSLDDANRVNEGKPVGIDVGFERRFVHHAANGEVGHHQPMKLLAHQLWSLAAQDDIGAAQARLQFRQRRLDFPALVIERGQFLGGRLLRIENGGDETIDRLGVGDALQPV